MIRARTVSQGTVRTRPAAKSRDLLSNSPAHAAATSSSGSSRLTNNSSATRTRSWRGRRRTSASNSSVDTDPSVPPGSGLSVRTHQAVLLALYRLLRGGRVRRLRGQAADRCPPPHRGRPGHLLRLPGRRRGTVVHREPGSLVNGGCQPSSSARISSPITCTPALRPPDGAGGQVRPTRLIPHHRHEERVVVGPG